MNPKHKHELLDNLKVMTFCADSFITAEGSGHEPVRGPGDTIKHEAIEGGLILHFKDVKVVVSFAVVDR